MYENLTRDYSLVYFVGALLARSPGAVVLFTADLVDLAALPDNRVYA